MQDLVTVAAVANSSFRVIFKRLDSDSPKKSLWEFWWDVFDPFLNKQVCVC